MNSADSQPELAPGRVLSLCSGYAVTLILEAAVRHGVFDLLDEGPRTVEETAAATKTLVRGLRAVMNALVGMELLARDDRGRYSLTPESAAFLVSTKPAFHGGVVRHASRTLIPNWLHLDEVVRTGQPSRLANREQEGAEFFRDFVEDLFPISYQAATVLADVLNIAQAAGPVRVLDLGAGSGAWGIALAGKSEQVTVTAVEWSEVAPVTRKVAARHGLEDRFRFVEGDLLEVDFGGDYAVCTIGHILHSEGEQRSRELLDKVFATLAPGGTVAIAEFVVDEDRRGPLPSLIFAVNMAVNTEQGDVFSFAQMSGWLEEAGFENVRQQDAPGPSPLILATRPGG